MPIRMIFFPDSSRKHPQNTKEPVIRAEDKAAALNNLGFEEVRPKSFYRK